MKQYDTLISCIQGLIHPLVVVYGPTACGKTQAAIDIARLVSGEIISVDARQIYRGLDIGTGKVTQEEMCGIPHALLDILSPDESFSVVEYRDRVRPILEDIWNRGKTPILCGGTGLYIDSIIFERSYVGKPPDTVRRRELEILVTERGKHHLWSMLSSLDPLTASRIHPNNHHAVIRAIEVFESQGIPKSSVRNTPTLLFPTCFYSPYDGDRAALYKRIDARVEQMFQIGLVEEVRDLHARFPGAPGLDTIGYKEVIDYLDGMISLPACITLVQQHSRNYAKRQITWNKKYDTFREKCESGHPCERGNMGRESEV